MMESPLVLVCGGAGYIGAHMCKRLAAAGWRPVVFDNLSSGHRHSVKWGPLVVGDLLDPDALDSVFTTYSFRAVLHFAAKSVVAESVAQPSMYFRNNVVGTLNLLDAMRRAAVNRLVFSSTAAVYGNPDYTPIDEAHPTRPVSPYGWSKLAAEHVIRGFADTSDLRAVCLRYFNAAGADPDGEIGEAHEPETHLIPNLLSAAVDAGAPAAKIYGNDYETSDGTCVRDYVHVDDICEAHLLALDLLERGERGCRAINLGSGRGYSVNEVLSVCRSHCDGRPAAEQCARRAGDPATLVASVEAARTALGWRPTRSLEDCVVHALHWMRGPHRRNWA